MPDSPARKVLLIGWDAADWNVIDPLLEAGHMPALQRLIERGVRGNIATLDPPFSPMLWTSIATGKTADQHGIFHFTQPREDGINARPVLSLGRKVKALWNILSQEGLRSNVVGWWPSHPAEPIRGAMVSNFFQKPQGLTPDEWPLDPDAVHPPELAERLAALRVLPTELTASLLLPFIPRLREVDQGEDQRPLALAKNLAEAATVQAVTTHLMEATDWDLTAVYFDMIDHLGHGFMKYHPPKLPTVTDEEFERYRHVVTACYRFHDMMLERLLQLAGEDATVVLLSDHGFRSDHLRPHAIPKVPAGPAVEHRALGVLCMAGPGIKRGGEVYGAGLLNIAPTVLTLFGLPVGRDMAAPPLVQAFEEAPEIDYVDSWEEIEGESGMHAPDARLDPWAEQEAMRQLMALGYIEPPEEDESPAESATRESKFNLARVYQSTGRLDEALPLFEEVYAMDSKYRAHYGLWLAHAYLEAGRVDGARTIAGAIEAEEITFPAALYMLRVDILLADDEPGEALALLDSLDASHPDLLLRRASALLRLRRFDDAERIYRDAIAQDPDEAKLWHGLAKAAIGRKDFETAAEAALAAVGRRYDYPEAHFHLGVASLSLRHWQQAEAAFRVALAQRPGLAPAHHWLAKLYRHLQRPDLAEPHEQHLRETASERAAS